MFRRSRTVIAACAALALVLVVWMVSLGSGADDRSDRIVEVYARQMGYDSTEAEVARQEALDWSAEVCSMKIDDDGAFVRGVTSTIDDLIETADAGCPEQARGMRAWKAANPDDF